MPNAPSQVVRDLNLNSGDAVELHIAADILRMAEGVSVSPGISLEVNRADAGQDSINRDAILSDTVNRDLGFETAVIISRDTDFGSGLDTVDRVSDAAKAARIEKRRRGMSPEQRKRERDMAEKAQESGQVNPRWDKEDAEDAQQDKQHAANVLKLMRERAEMAQSGGPPLDRRKGGYDNVSENIRKRANPPKPPPKRSGRRPRLGRN